MKHIKQLLQEMRTVMTMNDMSQKSLAEESGKTAPQISLFLNGKSNPTYKTVKDIGDAINGMTNDMTKDIKVFDSNLVLEQ